MPSKDVLLKENRELFWDVSDVSKLDDQAVEERFFKYGNWKNIQDLIALFWWEKLRDDYVKIRDKKRNDLPKKLFIFLTCIFMFKEIFYENQLQIIDILKVFSKDFYLAGWTAIARIDTLIMKR